MARCRDGVAVTHHCHVSSFLRTWSFHRAQVGCRTTVARHHCHSNSFRLATYIGEKPRSSGYQDTPATAVTYREAAFVAYAARSRPPSSVASTSPVAAKSPASAAVRAVVPDSREQAAVEVPKRASKKLAARTSARHEPSPWNFVSAPHRPHHRSLESSCPMDKTRLLQIPFTMAHQFRSRFRFDFTVA